MFRASVLFAFLLAVIVGCEGGGKAPVVDQKPPVERIRASLEKVASSPTFGSEVGLMFGAVEEMKKTEPEKGQALHAELNEMMKLNGPARQAKAKEILAKLPPSAP